MYRVDAFCAERGANDAIIFCMSVTRAASEPAICLSYKSVSSARNYNFLLEPQLDRENFAKNANSVTEIINNAKIILGIASVLPLSC